MRDGAAAKRHNRRSSRAHREPSARLRLFRGYGSFLKPSNDACKPDEAPFGPSGGPAGNDPFESAARVCRRLICCEGCKLIFRIKGQTCCLQVLLLLYDAIVHDTKKPNSVGEIESWGFSNRLGSRMLEEKTSSTQKPSYTKENIESLRVPLPPETHTHTHARENRLI